MHGINELIFIGLFTSGIFGPPARTSENSCHRGTTGHDSDGRVESKKFREIYLTSWEDLFEEFRWLDSKLSLIIGHHI